VRRGRLGGGEPAADVRLLFTCASRTSHAPATAPSSRLARTRRSGPALLSTSTSTETFAHGKTGLPTLLSPPYPLTRALLSSFRCSYLPMLEVMIPVVRQIPDIRKEAGQLNLRYERQEPSAVKIFRKARWLDITLCGCVSAPAACLQMVTDCLSGVQETLNTCALFIRCFCSASLARHAASDNPTPAATQCGTTCLTLRASSAGRAATTRCCRS